MSLANRVRAAESDGGFDDAPVGGYLQAELLPSCAFDGRGRQVLRLKRHGRPVRRGDENGGPQPRISGDSLGVLRAHEAPGHLGLKQVVQEVADFQLRQVPQT